MQMEPPLRRSSTTAVALLLNAIPSAAQQDSPSAALPAQPADQAITLSWTPIAAVARYELWSWNSNDDLQQLGGDNLTAAAYTHTGLTLGAAYYYQIRAIDADGQVGVWSQRISVSLPSALAPPARTASASESAVVLSWNAVPGAARYELWIWWRDDTGWQKLGGDYLTADAYTHAGIIPGVTCYYQARAVNADGVTGPWSQQVSAEPSQVPPTGAASTPASSPSPAPSASPTLSTESSPASTPTATPLVPLMTHSLLVTGDAPPVLVAQATTSSTTSGSPRQSRRPQPTLRPPPHRNYRTAPRPRAGALRVPPPPTIPYNPYAPIAAVIRITANHPNPIRPQFRHPRRPTDPQPSRQRRRPPNHS